MRRFAFIGLTVLVATGLAFAQYGKPAGQAAAKPDFNMQATYIEACSCDMFCPCYFGKATHHGEKHFCKFALVLKVDKGQYKDVKLDGIKTWLSGDLGEEWNHAHAGEKPKAGWLVVTFEPTITEAQQVAMTDILLQLYPLKWDILGVDKSAIEWKIDEKSGTATARMANGKAEVVLERWKGAGNKEAVLQNVNYWAAQSNTGFRMWKNKVHRFEGFGQKFSYSGTNGFLITINFSGNATQKSAAD